MSQVKHSIKKQYSLIFSLLLMGSILLICIFNIIILGRYYIYNKQATLLTTYKEIDKYAVEGDMNSENFEKRLNEIASINNIEALILDPDNQTVITTGGNEKLLAVRLLDYIFKGTDDFRKIYSDDKVNIQIGARGGESIEYLELWGFLSSNNLVIMRTPIQSMKEASVIANKTFIVIGLVISVVGFIAIWFVSKSLTKPVMDLVNISEKMTKLDFTQKYTSWRGNEIDVLGGHINSLSDNLERTISELKAANIQLQRDIDKKNEIDEMRRDFISNVSHELKTPIALIQGYAEGLKDCVNDDADSRDFYCDVIVDEANKMNKLVRNLLNLAEIESGNNVVMEHFDLVELINNCVKSFDMVSKNANITVEVEGGNEQVLVWSDEFKIEQVVTNYISNAINHVDESGIININISRVEGNVRVGVFNKGENIPDEIIDDIWVKFYKADKARTRQYGGSGIGLSIVKAIMDALSHDYGVANLEDGVEFWFEVDANEV